MTCPDVMRDTSVGFIGEIMKKLLWMLGSNCGQKKRNILEINIRLTRLFKPDPMHGVLLTLIQSTKVVAKHGVAAV